MAHRNLGAADRSLQATSLDAASPDAAANSALAGRTLPSGLRILRQVDTTPEGRVYEAQYPDGVEVALLVIRPATIANGTLQRERLSRATRIRHPNVAAVHEVGELEDGSFYAALEQFVGEPLSERMSEGQVFALRDAVDVTRQTAAGIEAAYQEGFVHGNLSPFTILAVPAPGTGSRVKLTGFVLRQELHQRTGKAPNLPPTVPQFASPERLMGQPPDQRSEVFSLGAVFHHLLVGLPPDGGELNDSAPSVARALLERALAGPPDRRFQTISELVDALGRLEEAAADDKRAIKRRAVLLGTVGTAVALVLGSWLLARSGPTLVADSAPVTARRTVPTAVPQVDRGGSTETGMVTNLPAERSPPPPPEPTRAERPQRTKPAGERIVRTPTAELPPASAKSNSKPVEASRKAAPGPTTEARSRPADRVARPAPAPGARGNDDRIVRGPLPPRAIPAESPKPPPTRRPPADSPRPPAVRYPSEPPVRTASEPRPRAELIQDQGLRQSFGDIARLGIAVDLAETRPGSLRVWLTPAAMDVPSVMYNLQRLYLAYSAATRHQANVVVELWQGGALYGRFTREGLVPAGPQ